MNNKNKILSVVLATSSAVGLGFNAAFYASALGESEISLADVHIDLNTIITTLRETEAFNVLRKNMANHFNNDGSLNVANLTDAQKTKLKNIYNNLNITYNYNGDNGSYSLTLNNDGVTLNEKQLKEIGLVFYTIFVTSNNSNNIEEMVQDLINQHAVLINKYLKYISIDGNINVDLMREELGSGFISGIKSALGILGYKIERLFEGYEFKGYRLVDANGKVVLTQSQLRMLLGLGKSYVDNVLNPSDNDGGDVYYGGGGSSGGSSFVGYATPLSTSTSTGSSTNLSAVTSLPILKTYTFDAKTAGQEIDLGKILSEAFGNLKQAGAIVLKISDSITWVIESTEVDLSQCKDLKLNLSADIESLAKTKVNIPDNLKVLIGNKNTQVLNFAEKNHRQLPFNVKVIAKLGKDYINKKMDVNYIVDGKSYNAGSLKANGNGEVVTKFKLMGDFTFSEAN